MKPTDITYARVKTPTGRVSYPSVFTPSAFDDHDKNDPRYSITLLFDKETDLKALKEAAQKAVAKKWPDPNTRPKSIRSPFRDGNEKVADNPKQQEYEDMIFISARSKSRPGVIGPDKNPITEDEFYPGCYAKATVSAFAYDVKGNRGVSFGLGNIQKVADGEPFTAAGIPAEEEFDVETSDMFDDTDTPPQGEPQAVGDIFS